MENEYCILTGRIERRDITAKVQEPFSNLTNETFRYTGPRCWTQFRLNRFEVIRCLRE